MAQSNVIQGYFPHGNGRTTALPPQLANFARGGGQPLPPAIQRQVETAFRTSFADVRVHVGPQAAAIGAVAFTHGSNVYFAPGQYDPHTARGQRVLWHELTHVVQQKTGRVRNPFGNGIAVVHDRLLEAEAERMSLQAGRLQPPPMRTAALQAKAMQPRALQLKGVQLRWPGRVVQRSETVTTASSLPDISELTLIDEGLRFTDAEFYRLTSWDPETVGRGAGVFVSGKLFSKKDGELKAVTETMVNEYWDPKYSGFARTTRPDWRYNCGDYALSANGTDSVANESTALSTYFNLVFALAGKSAGDVETQFATEGQYVVNVGSHYFRVHVNGSQAVVSQKDGDSGVYSKTMTLAAAAEYVLEKQTSVRNLYLRK